MVTNKTIVVKGTKIAVFRQSEEDYISLSGIARHRDPERSDYILQNWLRNRSTIVFIGLWELLNNPGFNSIEFDGFKNQAGLKQLFTYSKEMDRSYSRFWHCFQSGQIWRHGYKPVEIIGRE
jgi:hypothetical protein